MSRAQSRRRPGCARGPQPGVQPGAWTSAGDAVTAPPPSGACTKWHAATCRDASGLWCSCSSGLVVAQISGWPSCVRSGQRGWKRHPVGGLSGDGTSPVRITRRRRSRASGIGMADIRARVYGCCGLRKMASRSASSAMLPEVHDRDAIADVLDDAHVVGDEDVGEPQLGLERLEQVEHLRLDRDIERRHRLVAHDQLRLEDQRPGDADPLALAAGELVRDSAGRGTRRAPPGPSSGSPSRAARHRSRSRGCGAPRRCCRRSGSAGRVTRTGPGR